VHLGEKKKHSIKSTKGTNKKLNTDFRLSQCLITDVNSVLGLLRCVVVVSVADVSEVHLPSSGPAQQRTHFSCEDVSSLYL
jgi:hypothetical protein